MTILTWEDFTSTVVPYTPLRFTAQNPQRHREMRLVK